MVAARSGYGRRGSRLCRCTYRQLGADQSLGLCLDPMNCQVVGSLHSLLLRTGFQDFEPAVYAVPDASHKALWQGCHRLS